MTTVAIMQPAYLPWLGYFDLLDMVDVFILLDNVQFSRRSWQQRNRIKTNLGLQWLTLPVVHEKGALIREVMLADQNVGARHAEALRRNYARAACFAQYFAKIQETLVASTCTGSLLQVNRRLIGMIREMMGIHTPALLASDIGANAGRSARLASLCAAVQATTYVSPPGSAVYLIDELREFDELGIEVVFHRYEHPDYRQLYPPFLPQASAIDLLLNEGERALEIMRTGRRSPQSVAAMSEQSRLCSKEES